MIYGIGVDIMDIARLETLRGKYDDPFFVKTFTDSERSAALRRRDPIRYFAKRFAAKEAVFKALNGRPDAFRFNEIETLNDERGQPYVVLYGETRKFQELAGIGHIHISLSDDGGFVIAYAVCETFS